MVFDDENEMDHLYLQTVNSRQGILALNNPQLTLILIHPLNIIQKEAEILTSTVLHLLHAFHI